VRLVRIAKCIFPAGFLVLVGVLLFPSAGRDDSHITYWAAYVLSHFGEILNYNGDRVEQSSSLLHVLLLAGLHLVSGIDLVVAGRVLSVLCGVATLAAVHRLGERVRTGVGFAAAVLSASSVFFVYWSFGGLESSLASLSVIGLILAWASYLQVPGRWSLTFATLGTVFVALVRPEMPLVLLCMLVGSSAVLGLRRWTGPSDSVALNTRLFIRLGILAGVSAGVCLLLFAFRIAYFDSLMPQPVIAKSAALSLQRASDGFQYLISGFHPSTMDGSETRSLATWLIGFIFVIGVVGALRAAWDEIKNADMNPYTLLSLMFLAAYYSFIILTEGDWMEGGRMISHALPVAAIFVAHVLTAAFRSNLLRRIALTTLFVLQSYVLLDFVATRSVGMPLWTSLAEFENYATEYGASRYSYFDRTNRDHLRNIPTLDRLDRIVDELLLGDREKVQIMAHQMGFLPYYLSQKYFGRVQFFDLNGLTDRVTTTAVAFSSTKRKNTGTSGVLTQYLRDRARFEADPDVETPDLIVYQFYTPQIPFAPFRKHGFEIIYVQTGKISSGSRHFPGRRVWANQLIAIRRELLPELTDASLTRLDIHDTGTVRPDSAW
jgi:hypothetical protein